MTSLKHADIHHQSPPPLSLTHIKSEGNFFTYALSGDNSQDLILYASSQSDGGMDFLLEGENGGGGSSRESVANLLDEGLGTSLDGTDEISSIHSTLGRNDSGVFSGDETTSLAGGVHGHNAGTSASASTATATGVPTVGAANGIGTGTVPATPTPKKHRPKNSSPNRQGPQRCAICGKQFSNASALTKHKLTHSDERKHACSLCGKAFKRQDHLNGHMLTHRNKKPFECTAKGCGKSYCDARSLRRHVESRHGHETLAAMTQSIAQAQLDSAGGSSASASSSPTQQLPTDNSPSSNPSTPAAAAMANVKVKLIVTTAAAPNSHSQPQTILTDSGNNILMDTATMDMAQILGLTIPDAAQLIDGQVLLDSGRNDNLPNAEEKLVLVKIESPEENAGAMALEPPKKPTMRTSQSQLHQLLTQRASNKQSPYAANTMYKNGFWGTTTATAAAAAAAPTVTVKTEVPDNVNVNEMKGIGGGDSGCPSGGGNGGKKTQNKASGLVSKSSDENGTNTPRGLKEQLDFIAQIIQRAQLETKNAATAGAAAGATKGGKGGSKKSRTSSASAGSSASLKIEGDKQQQQPSCSSASSSSSSASSSGGEDKPVECTMCFRRFKNTPALNGHMRLHGGYFKKDSDGKRRDPSCVNPSSGGHSSNGKDSSNLPLQTISQSVKDLIGKKINQKSINGNATATAAATVNQGMERCVNQVSSSTQGNGFMETLVSLSSSTGGNGLHVPNAPNPLSLTFSSVSPCNSLEVHGHPDTPPQIFQYVNIYSDEGADNGTAADEDYLLMEQEVFNKVSSICPDSFLNGIDESILSVTAAVGNDELGPEWSWTGNSTPGPDSVNSRLNSFFTGAASASSPDEQTTQQQQQQQFNKLEGGGGPFTPLPPLDPVFYNMSPAPQSPSLHSQDSPSFIYPTPPASLESHNALQSPLFPFPTTTATTQNPTSTSASATLIFPFETNNFNGSGLNEQFCANANNNDGLAVSPDVIFATTPTSSPSGSYVSSSSSNLLVRTTGSQVLRHFGSVVAKGRNHSGGSGDLNLNFLTPSNSPSLVTTTSIGSGSGSSGSSCSEDSFLHSAKELKINEPSRMDCSMGEEDIFLNPNSVPNSPSHRILKSPKRKQILRNTFASNLRPHPGAGGLTHFTPYPILSPVRSAPGLYWKFSTQLTHVDDSKKETARINVGTNFQADIPPSTLSRRHSEGEEDEEKREDLMWDSKVMEVSTEEEVDTFLEFACCSAIPGGGRNKEYALHLLRLCDGDINEAILLLMNPNPELPEYLRCNYPENAKWSLEELMTFQDALLRHGKDFVEVSKEIQSKNTQDCITFYQVWKKVYSKNYEKIRNIWKKRDAAFTMDLLKTVPPPLVTSRRGQPTPTSTHIVHSPSVSMSSILELTEVKNQVPVKILDTPSPAALICDPFSHTHEEFPCKVCGKIFNKVKSRSAHMKSHRPPEPQPQQQQSDNLTATTSGPPNAKKAKYQATPTSMTLTSGLISPTPSDSSSMTLASSLTSASPTTTATATTDLMSTTTSATESGTKSSSSGSNRDT